MKCYPDDLAEAADDRASAVLRHCTAGHDGPGWYYWSHEYPDEGSVGAFATREDAIAHLEAHDMFLETEEPGQ